ncbi:MAG: IS110 family transposase [bacterium]
MSPKRTLFPKVTIGLDLGDKMSQVYEIDTHGEPLCEAKVATTPDGLQRHFGGRPRCRVVLEVGTHSPWVSRLLAELGHETIVANPSAMYGTRRRRRRNDRLDAAFLARQGRADVALLYPIHHRGLEAQQHLAIIRARDEIVSLRTALINHVRGAVKSVGGRLPTCSAEAFPKRVVAAIPAGVVPALQPMVETITDLTRRIDAYDAQVAQLAARYPEVQRLQQPSGVGLLTALTYVLLVEDPRRFHHSRSAGAYFGLVPRLDESSASSPQLRISKAGDELGRRLLVNAAHYILGPFGPDCTLRRFGTAIAQRGGKNAKKRAVIAVARKLAVLLHRLWVSDTPYDPNYAHHRAA